jgi:hypothetical protein
LFPGLLTNGVAEILNSSPSKLAAENWSQEKRNKLSSVTDRQKDLASAFREHMTKGQTFHTTNSYRNEFYTDVINESKEVNFLFFPVSVRMMVFFQVVRKSTKGSVGLKDAGELLCRFIDEDEVSNSKHGPRRPLVVLAFDEADTLADNPPGKDWNLFSELHRVLRQINHLQIFSLFLSTGGRFPKFSPNIPDVKSARARHGYPTLNPILEISFDDIAYPASEDTVTIGRVVEIDWICHLGRPLYVRSSYSSRELFTYHLE